MAQIDIVKSDPDEEESKFEFSLQGHLKVVQDCLHSQWLDGTFCDLELQTFGGSILVHACLIAAFSPKIATKLNNIIRKRNSKMVGGNICLDVNFNYCIIKTIVESFYSGLFSAPLENLSELYTALKWLEIDELIDVVKSVQDKVQKENLITQDIEHLLDKPRIKNVRQKNQHKPQKSKSFTKQVDYNQDGIRDSVNVVVSLVNDMPYFLSLGQRDKGTLKEDFKSEVIQEESKQNVVHNQVEVHDDNNINNKLNKFDQLHVSEKNESLTISDENDLYTSQDLDLINESIDTVHRQKSKRSRKKLTKRKKIAEKYGRPPKSTNKREKLDRNKDKKKSKSDNSFLSEMTLKRSYLPNIIEGEEEKKKHATEALMTIGGNAVKEEIQEADQLKQESTEEQEQLFLNGEIDCLLCNKCKSSFSDLDEYKSHIHNHPTYTCENCFTVYFSSTLLCRHIRSAHLKSMHLKCTQCDFTAQTDGEFKQHCAEVHDELRPFKCLFEGCEFKTVKYRYLSRHFENHENIRHLVCEKCKKSFNNCALLYSHKRSCYHVQKYLCDICGQSFNHPGSMKIHRRTMHFGEKPYKCQVCQKCFSNGANLRRHMRIHNNIYPYSCSICTKQFRHSNSMKIHMSKHKETIDSNNVVHAEVETVYPQHPSVHHQLHSSISSSSSIQVYDIQTFPSSLSSPLSTMPANTGMSQAFVTAPVITAPNMQPFPVTVSVPHDHTTSFLQYDNQIPWHEAESYRLSNL